MSPLPTASGDPVADAVRTALRRPAHPLSSFVSHYWLIRDNADPAHPVLPDGCIDVVFEVGRTTRIRVYGAATRRFACAALRGAHYLGICFRPGQGRRFLPFPAGEIKDGSADLRGLAGLEPEALADDIARAEVFGQLDTALTTWLARYPTDQADPVDPAIARIDRSHGRVRIESLASEARISRRHLERRFLERVGIAPKSYAGIRRWQRAMDLLRTRPADALADIALSAGYADQSHMNRDFLHRAGHPPRQAAHVAFVQDASYLPGYLSRVS